MARIRSSIRPPLVEVHSTHEPPLRVKLGGHLPHSGEVSSRPPSQHEYTDVTPDSLTATCEKVAQAAHTPGEQGTACRYCDVFLYT